jgi:coenzyme F420-0:L-glutamate ligase/coenzyme F420-1:gamma-L-glutamate ligase
VRGAEAIALIPVTGIGEIVPGADLSQVLADALAPSRPGAPALETGDVVVVTQKVVSKAEGQLVPRSLWSSRSRYASCAGGAT